MLTIRECEWSAVVQRWHVLGGSARELTEWIRQMTDPLVLYIGDHCRPVDHLEDKHRDGGMG